MHHPGKSSKWQSNQVRMQMLFIGGKMKTNRFRGTKAIIAIMLAMAMICVMFPQTILAADSTTSYIAITSDVHDKPRIIKRG